MRGIIDKRYRILRKLGSGAMGEVYKVEDLSYNRIIALKVISKKMASSEAVKRFRREFKLLAGLKHPSLCAVYDFGTLKDGRDYYTMDYVDGPNIFEFTKKLSYEEIYPLIVQLCRVLEYIHSKGLIHYDIKPGNVLMAGSTEFRHEGTRILAGQSAKGIGQRIKDTRKHQAQSPVFYAKLLDFGLAGEHRIRGGALVRGTFPYIAPEVVKGLAIDHRADLFSLGILLYEIITRKSLQIKDEKSFVTFLKQQEKVVSELPSKIVSDVPERLEKLIMRLIEFKPEERYSRANEIIREINKVSYKKFEIETEKTLEGYLLSSKFVGRDKEMGFLKSLYENAQRGEGKVVLIVGEAGIGKSRLLREFRIFIQLRRGYNFIGYTHKEKPGALEPFHDIFCELVNYIKDNHDLFRSRKLRLSLAVLFKIFPDLSDGHLKRSLPSVVPLEPQQEKLRNFEAISELLGYSASHLGRLVILLEDLHWADDVTIQCLEYLGRNLGGRNILLCGTCRKEEIENNQIFNRMIANLENERYFNQLRLKPLNFQNLYSFLDSMMTPKSNSPDLVKYLMDKTGGNPFFVEEIMRTLLHRKGANIGGKIEIEHLQKVSIPETIEDVILKRFRDLDGNSKKVVKYGAVLLKEFNYELMKHLTGLEDTELSESLWKLRKGQILVEKDNAYQFYHATLRDAVNNRMAYREKRRLYYQVGKIIERIFRKNREKVVEDLAFYFINAKDQRKGIRYGLRAAKNSRDRYANEQAIRFYKNVLTLLNNGKPRQRFELMQELADVMYFAGHYNDAVRCYNNVLNQGILPIHKRITIYLRIGNIYENKGEFNRAINVFRKGIKLIKEMKPCGLKDLLQTTLNVNMYKSCQMIGEYDNTIKFNLNTMRFPRWRLKGNEAIRLQASVYNNLGTIGIIKGEYENIILYYNKAYKFFKKIKAAGEIAAVLNNFGIYFFLKNEFQKAFDYFQRSIRISEKTGNHFGVLLLSNNLGVVFKDKGYFSKALACFQKALSLSRKTGNRGNEGTTLWGIGDCFYKLCNYKEAKEYCEKALKILDTIGYKDRKSHPIECLGNIYQAMGDYNAALRFYRKALKIDKDARRQPLFLTHIGSVLAEMGQFSRARRYVENALNLANAIKSKELEVECYIVLCRINIMIKKYAVANDYYERAIKMAEELMMKRQSLQLFIMLAEICYHEGKYRMGIMIANKIIRKAKEMGTKDLLAEALLVKVENGIKQGVLSATGAVKILDEAMEIAVSIGGTEILWRIYSEYGRLLEKNRDFLGALAYCQKSIDIFRGVTGKMRNESDKRGYLNRPDRQAAMRRPALLIAKYRNFLNVD